MAYHRRLTGFAAPMIALAVVACAGNKPYQASVDVHLLHPRVPPSSPKGNSVAIVAFPIFRENLGDYGEIARYATWTEMNAVSSGINSTRRGLLSLVPLPAFQIHVVNQTSQPFSLSETQVQVEDNKGREYSLLADYVSLKGRFVADMHGMNSSIANDKHLIESLLREIHQIPLLNPGVVVQPGQTWVGYVVLNTDAHNPDEYRAMMSSLNNLVIRFRNFPKGLGTEQVELFVDKVVQPINVSCPWDVKQPSLERCTPEEPSKKRPQTLQGPAKDEWKAPLRRPG
jgi:hypothetical protein